MVLYQLPEWIFYHEICLPENYLTEFLSHKIGFFIIWYKKIFRSKEFGKNFLRVNFFRSSETNPFLIESQKPNKYI